MINCHSAGANEKGELMAPPLCFKYVIFVRLLELAAPAY